MKKFLAGGKTKIETVLDDGSKILIVINGSAPQKIMKFLKLLEELENDSYIDTTSNFSINTIYMKIYNLIRYEFGRAGFTLNDVYRAYLIKYNDDSVKKNTISTYLSRMVEEKILEREGKRGNYIYRYIEVQNHIYPISYD